MNGMRPTLLISLNAPCGAGCFLPPQQGGNFGGNFGALMHLVVLGAF